LTQIIPTDEITREARTVATQQGPVNRAHAIALLLRMADELDKARNKLREEQEFLRGMIERFGDRRGNLEAALRDGDAR
jgi:hypothetical protein